MKIERRWFQSPNLRLDGKGAESEKDIKIRGHAAIFNELSVDLGGFREKIDPGAFAKSILEDDVRALWNHNADMVLGRNKSGTLKLTEDERGLAIEIDPPDTQLGRDVMCLMQRGDVTQMSFGFTVPDGGERWEMIGGVAIRTLTAVNLFETPPVVPALPSSKLGLYLILSSKSLIGFGVCNTCLPRLKSCARRESAPSRAG
jgi:hypothetical protein